MGLRLFFLPKFPGAMFIQGATFIPDPRVHMICEPTFNVNDKLFGLDLKTLFGAGPNFADPGPGIPQVQVGHTDGAVKVWIFSKPLDTAPLNVNALANYGVVHKWRHYI